MVIETWPIEKLIPYPGNPRCNDDAVSAVERSLAEYGWQQPIVVDTDGVVIVGHTRLKAAQRLGYTEVPVHVASLSPEKARAYRIADNQTATIAEWDLEKLPIELFALEEENYDLSLLGFSAEDLARIMGKDVEDGLTDPDDVPEPPESPVTQPGDLWVLGRHRVLCGDATKPEDVQRLMDGKLADLWLTDPPYNVGYTGKTLAALTIANDSMSDDAFRSFLVKAFGCAFSVMKPGAAFYIWHADSEGFNFRGAVHACGERVRQCLIWVKNSMVMGRQDYHWIHEPCQPPGTMVRTPTGCVPIETLRDGDRVVSYDSYSGVITGLRDGQAVKVASRQYEGKLYGVSVAGRQTWATDAHRFTVRCTKNVNQSRRVTGQVAACNLIPEAMEVPVPSSGDTCDWSPITAVEVKDYSGPVYSLDVERDHHYIADGIVTHNCLYSWKSGAAHHWYSDRKQTTVLHFQRPSRSEQHPTIKPAAMFVYLMQNSSARDGIVLDTFAGSGTTLIAAEQTGRQAYVMELEPQYVDVICRRYLAFAGDEPVREHDGATWSSLRQDAARC